MLNPKSLECPRLAEVLICPCCGEDLASDESSNSLVCRNCELVYPRSERGQLDLRLRRPKSRSIVFELDALSVPDGVEFSPLIENRDSEADLNGIEIPHHLSRELVSHFPRAQGQDSAVLDLGCGEEIHRRVCERLGFIYFGLDYDNPRATLLGDAHALPLRSESVDFVLSIAVIEHLRYPFIAIQEIYRVLKPGGRFVGTVAFLEPCHGNSFYHHTHLGVYNLLAHGGFQTRVVAPSSRWSGLVAQATMGLFPRMPSVLARGLVAPIVALHRLWWGLGRLTSKDVTETRRLLTLSGSFAFIADKSQ